jgi:hypothetical protein
MADKALAQSGTSNFSTRMSRSNAMLQNSISRVITNQAQIHALERDTAKDRARQRPIPPSAVTCRFSASPARTSVH